jgi:hypothetical protein
MLPLWLLLMLLLLLLPWLQVAKVESRNGVKYVVLKHAA